MQVYLQREKEWRMTSLPEKIGGRHFVYYTDEFGHNSPLLSITAQNGEWVLQENEKCKLVSKNDESRTTRLKAPIAIDLEIKRSESASLLVLDNQIGVGSYQYYRINSGETISFGTDSRNHVVMNPSYYGQTAFTLCCQGNAYSVSCNFLDRQSVLYLDRRLVYGTASARIGSVLFIHGLSILLGDGFFALNNPYSSVTTFLPIYQPADFSPLTEEEKLTRSRNYDALFSAAPRIYRSEECREFIVENPPQPLDDNKVSDLVMMGPALTMAAGSLFSSVFTIHNLTITGGNIASAVPSLVISLTMVTGMAVWPTLSRKMQRKHQEEKNRLSEEDYHNYLKWLSAEIQKTADLQRSVANQNHPTLRSCIDIIAGADPALWNRRRRHEDFLTVMIGKGSLPLNVEFKYPERSYSSQISESAKEMYGIMEQNYIVDDVPITIPLTRCGIVGVLGERSNAINFLRALLIELTALHGFDDVHIAVIYNREEEAVWHFVKWIPHIWNEDRSFRYIATSPDEMKRLSDALRTRLVYSKDNERQKSYYIIIAADMALADRCDLIKEIYESDDDCNMTVLTLGEQQHSLPKQCRYVVNLASKNGLPSLIDYDDTSGIPLVFHDYVSCKDDPTELFVRMANVRTGAVQKGELATMLTFMEMCNAGRVEHIDVLGSWRDIDPVESLGAQIGVDYNGYPITLDIHEKAHGPHGLIAGMTGSGKSEFIISYIAAMSMKYSPEDVAFVLIDFKGGGMADIFRDMPHTAGLITNLDGNELKRSFMAIESELQKRQRLFKEISEEKKISNIDIYKYQKLRRTDKNMKPLPHLIIISDEFAELKQQHRDFMEQLIRIARIGRSLGVHLILATQKPDGVVDDQIKSNIHFKVCLKVQDRSDSKAMIGRPDAAEINNSGRFYFQVGNDELFEYGQSPWSGARYVPADAPKTNITNSISVLGVQGNALLRVSPPPVPSVPGVPEKQIDAIVAYLGEIAAQNGIRADRLWLKPIEPPKVRTEKMPTVSTEIIPYVLNPVVGVYDDLENQRHLPLVVPFTFGGNTLLYGAAGSGTLEFINTMLVELMNRHTPEELSLYLFDFDAGFLSAFENAPHTRGFAASVSPNGKQLLSDLEQELKQRKDVLKEYGGDYQNYVHLGGRDLPNCLLVIHNFQNYMESFSETRQIVSSLAREGTQYGMYIFLSGTTGNSIPYAMQPLFRNIYTLQQNNDEQYREILGKIDGIVPQNYRGRGLVKVNGAVCEFQTNLVFQDADNQYRVLQAFCEKLREKYGSQMPKTIEKKQFRWDTIQTLGLHAKPDMLPVAFDPQTAEPILLSLYDQVNTLVLYEEETKNAYYGVIRLLRSCGAEMRYFGTDSDNMRLSGWEVVPPPRFNDGISEIWAEMQKRAKEGQEAKLNNQPVPDYEHMVYIFDSVSVIMEWLSDRSRQQLVTLLCGLSIGYHMHFILLDSAEKSGVLMGPTYLQRSAPFVQGLILSHNPSAMMLFSQKEHHLLSDGEESLIITKDSALSGIVLTASREER